jgi:hypothetical protein
MNTGIQSRAEGLPSSVGASHASSIFPHRSRLECGCMIEGMPPIVDRILVKECMLHGNYKPHLISRWRQFWKLVEYEAKTAK